MTDWIDELAEALGQEPLGAIERSRLLQASREVAHRVERKFTPLAAYLMGAAVARRGSTEDRVAALDRILEAVETTLPPTRPGSG